MKKISGVPINREYTLEDFERADERVRAARERLLLEPAAKEAHQRLGEEIAGRVQRKRAKLAEVRRAVGLTQEQLADTLGMDQGEISRLEHRENVHLSTLSRFIEATGGELRVVARYGTSEIELAIGDIAPVEELTDESPVTNVRSQLGIRSDRARKGGGVVTTSKKDASKAGRILANPKASKDAKSVAASDLAQAKGRGKGKGK